MAPKPKKSKHAFKFTTKNNIARRSRRSSSNVGAKMAESKKMRKLKRASIRETLSQMQDKDSDLISS